MYEIFEKLCAQKGVTAYRVGKETGISTPTFSNWKNGKYTPKDDKMKLIAEYFGVSVDYLRNGEESEKESTSGKKYYFNDETADLAQALYEDPNQRVLFNASRNARPEDLQMAADLLNRLKETNPNG